MRKTEKSYQSSERGAAFFGQLKRRVAKDGDRVEREAGVQRSGLSCQAGKLALVGFVFGSQCFFEVESLSIFLTKTHFFNYCLNGPFSRYISIDDFRYDAFA